jgi:heme A synthase
LVKRGLVADDASQARAVVVGLHLGNTLLLTGSGALLAWVGTGRALRLPRRWADWAALLLILLVSMTGAVTALGDTLFPVTPASDGGLFARVRDGLDVGSHFLVRLRAVHPILATAVASWLLWRSSEVMLHSPPGSDRRRASAWLHGLVWGELACGFLNVMLAAPGWLQLVHLCLAQAVWIALVIALVATDDSGQRTSSATLGSTE